jgi:hypothetical protein
MVVRIDGVARWENKSAREGVRASEGRLPSAEPARVVKGRLLLVEPDRRSASD